MRTWFVSILGACLLGCATSSNGDTGAGDAAADGTSPPLATDGGLPANDGGPLANDGDADGAPPIHLGLSWPPGQVFPSFAPPGDLDVVLTSGRPADVLTLVVTLEGIVNKTRPRIYVSDDSGPSKLWLAETKARATTVADPLTLVTKYASEIAGVVITDDALADTLNLATTIAGARGGIVASPALAKTLTAPPYGLPVLEDLRTLHFASKLDVYRYELDHYAAQTTHRLIIGLTPGIVDHLRDYAVATNAMTVWLDPTNASEAALLDQFLALLPPNAPYLGWWTNEPAGVHQASTHGVPVFAADFSMNLTVLGGTPRGSAPPVAPPPPKLENKLYVAMFMSDGDNLQEDQGLIPLKWADGARGSVPISWTIDPALVDVAPVILRYYQRTATRDDLLVSGPSGLGYTYPAAWPSAVFDQYTKVSAGYLAAAGLRVVTVWNNGADLSAANAHSYAANAPDLLGLTMQDGNTALQFVDGTLPVDRMTLSYGDTAAILESGVDAALRGYDRTHPVFAAIQGNMNSGQMSPGAFAAVQQRYEANTNVVFVRADHFFELLSQVHAPPSHRVFAGDFDGDKRTDAAFYYGGNGDLWLGLSDGTKLSWSRAASASGFGDLLDGAHAFYTGDFTGDGKTDLAFYFAGDGNWWLGASSGAAITWSKWGNASSLGNLLDGKHDVRVGDYDGNGKTDVAIYDAGSGDWTFGLSDGAALAWKAAGSTSGFGDLLDGTHALYDGDFDGDGKADVLFFYDGDQNVWLGRSDGSALTWSKMGNASNFGNLIDHGHRLMAGDFTGDGRTDLLFHYAGDGNWWLGTSSGAALAWSQAGNTKAMGDLLDLDHHLFARDVDGDRKLDVIAYDGLTGDWVVGHSNGQALAWKAAGSTALYGDLADPTRLLFFGDVDGDGKEEPFFYFGGDGNWWASRSDGTSFAWSMAGNTSGFGDLTR